MQFPLIVYFIQIVIFNSGFEKAESQRMYSQLTDEVELTTGKIQGQIMISREGKEYYEFLGIPYARPPLNELRFEPPEPPIPWKDIRIATRGSTGCLHYNILISGRRLGSEDCLYLNVFTPKPRNSKLYPVIFFIHGGAFMSGTSSLYSGKYFMDHEIVLVTLDYRVGAFGFLSTDEGGISGNMGLKDQVMALKWVQENIRGFNGDPKRVTIAGQSAGGVSVHLHMISKLSSGLFHRAISQSGTALRKYKNKENGGDQAIDLATKIGCPTVIPSKMISCLKKASASKIVETSKAAVPVLASKFSLFVPVVEKVTGKDPFLTIDPAKSLITGDYENVPWMAGVNEREGLFQLARMLRERDLVERIDRDFDSILPSLLIYDQGRRDVAKKVREFYFKDIKTPSPVENIEEFSKMLSDRYYFTGLHISANLQSRYSPVYLSLLTFNDTNMRVFDYVKSIDPRGILPTEVQYGAFLARKWFFKNILRVNVPEYGPCHGDELSLLFNLNVVTEVRRGAVDYQMSRELVDLWVKFASEETRKLDFKHTRWEYVNPNEKTLKYMILDKKEKFIDEPFSDRMKFWASLNLDD